MDHRPWTIGRISDLEARSSKLVASSQQFCKSNSCMSLLYARMEKMKYFNYDSRFELETGKYLDGITIAYHTYGKLNASKSNAVWICHALTANSDVMDWWPGMVGKGC